MLIIGCASPDTGARSSAEGQMDLCHLGFISVNPSLWVIYVRALERFWVSEQRVRGHRYCYVSILWLAASLITYQALQSISKIN